VERRKKERSLSTNKMKKAVTLEESENGKKEAPTPLKKGRVFAGGEPLLFGQQNGRTRAGETNTISVGEEGGLPSEKERGRNQREDKKLFSVGKGRKLYISPR